MDGGNLSLFLLAAVIIAAIPGPGIFYVAARTLSGGRQAGIASTLGAALGGLAHVVAGGVGVSAIILASAQLFTMLKLAGALYLIWLGIRTIRQAGSLPPEQTGPIGTQRAFREGILVEALNPKTAAFFLAFIPQFLDPAAGYPALQFMPLGLISVALNTFADIIVVVAASTARTNLARRPHLVQRLRQGSGLFMAGSAYRWRWRVGLLPARLRTPWRAARRLQQAAAAPNMPRTLNHRMEARDGRKDIHRRRSWDDGIATP